MIDRRQFQLNCLATLLATVRPTDVSGSFAKKNFDSWTQWGGNQRNFSAPPVAADGALPEPQLLWERKLGKGHAAIISDGANAYSLRLEDQQEVLEQWNLESGERMWASRYEVDYHASIEEYDCPHATPLLLEDRVISVGIDGGVHAFDLSTGKRLWHRDLRAGVGTILPQSGYAASPLVWRDCLILPALGNARSEETVPSLVGRRLLLRDLQNLNIYSFA